MSSLPTLLLGVFREYFGIVSGLFRREYCRELFGSVSGSCSSVAALRVCCRKLFGSVSGIFRDCFGIVSRSFWECFGSVFSMLWVVFGRYLEVFLMYF